MVCSECESCTHVERLMRPCWDYLQSNSQCLKTYGYTLSGIWLSLLKTYFYPSTHRNFTECFTHHQAHRKKQYSIRQWNYIDIVTYLFLHSSQCVPLRQMYPRLYIYASIVSFVGQSFNETLDLLGCGCTLPRQHVYALALVCSQEAL